jgi:flavocytochrome c
MEKRIISLVLAVILVLTSVSFVFAESTYSVKPGDVLWKIAQKYNTTWQELAKLNKLENPNLIIPNQVIKLPTTEAETISSTFEGQANGVYGTPLKVGVVFSGKTIADIKILTINETKGIGDVAVNQIIQDIIKYQTVAVDTVSGATSSSKAAIAAVSAAITKAGMNLSDYQMKPQKEDVSKRPIEKKADVVVVGTGGAGMSAALEALRAGSSVIIIDKMSYVGGNTLVAGSAMNAPEPEKQKLMKMDAERMATIERLLALKPVDDYMARWQKTVSDDMAKYKANSDTYLYDSKDFYKLQIYVGGDYIGNPVLIETMAEAAIDSVNWLKDLGTIWKEEIVSVYGSTWTRGHNPTSSWGTAGAGFVLPQQREVEKLGGELLLGYKAEELVMKDGRVAAVTGTTSDGTVFTLDANKGVVLATGGFSANVEMREKYNTKWPSLLKQKTTNPASSTGDGIIMASEIDANLVGMEWIQLIPYSKKALTATIDGCIMLNYEGKRFVAEDERRDVIAAAALKQADQKMYWLYDRKTIIDELKGTSIYGEDIKTQFPNGTTTFYGETLKDIANQTKIPYETLKKTVDDYNSYVDAGVDPIGRKNLRKKIDQGPYALVVNDIMVHHTMGGVEINEKAEVLDTNGKIINGLYAAGEVTGGIHGSNRLGGNAITDIVTFGRIAGKNVSAR